MEVKRIYKIFEDMATHNKNVDVERFFKDTSIDFATEEEIKSNAESNVKQRCRAILNSGNLYSVSKNHYANLHKCSNGELEKIAQGLDKDLQADKRRLEMIKKEYHSRDINQYQFTGIDMDVELPQAINFD